MMDGANSIYVDLDQTLVRGDLFQEAILRIVALNPLNLFRVVFWLFRGRSYAKERVSQLTTFDPSVLQYNAELLDYLDVQKKNGKRIILATATHKSYADRVATHLGLFDDVLATNGNVNLKGESKLKAILDHAKGKAFIYAGDSAADSCIWEAASGNIFVNAPRKEVERSDSQGKTELMIASRRSPIKAFIKEMRPHQYAKNVLVLVPVVTSHSYVDSSILGVDFGAFVAFSLCASGGYFLNDLVDIESDRRHESKRNRPIAAGDVTIPCGILGALGLPILSFVLALAALPMEFFYALVVYYGLTNLYSFSLKRIHTLDVVTLASLYTLRVVAGGFATGIELSSWLLCFCLLIFLSLAYVKRYTEVSSCGKNDEVLGRGYSGIDSETTFVLGATSMISSVVLLSLYVQSETVTLMYSSPNVLLFLCVLMLYWGNRIWFVARRGLVNVDPVVFALKDTASWVVLLGVLVVVGVAKYL